LGALYGDRTGSKDLCRGRFELAISSIRSNDSDGGDDQVHSIGQNVLGFDSERGLGFASDGHSF
jgi:hypothetical protein